MRDVTDEASKAGVNSTPTVVAAGEVLESPTVDSLVAAVDAASRACRASG